MAVNLMLCAVKFALNDLVVVARIGFNFTFSLLIVVRNADGVDEMNRWFPDF